MGTRAAFPRIRIGVLIANSSEDAEAFFLRFYEWAGEESDIKLQLAAGANSAAETELVGKPVTGLAIEESTVSVRTEPSVVKTERIRFAPNLPAAPAERSPN